MNFCPTCRIIFFLNCSLAIIFRYLDVKWKSFKPVCETFLFHYFFFKIELQNQLTLNGPVLQMLNMPT